MREFNQRIKLPEMARLLSRSIKQFRADVSNYQIPYIQLGRNKLFDPKEVERYLTEFRLTISDSPTTQSSNLRSTKPHKIIKPDSDQSNRYQVLLGLV
jgi:Sec-independent protein translocase protein TatA